MFLKQTNINKTFLFLTAALMLIFWVFNTSLASRVEASGKNKAVVIVVDRISIEDIARANLPDLEQLINKGGIGLMNVRGRSFSWENRESGYLSLNRGARASYPDDSGAAGNFGRTAREAGLQIAVLDKNAGSELSREILLLAADEKGEVPFCATGADNRILLAQFKKLYAKADIIFINYGESTDALAGADELLGGIMNTTEPEKTLFFVLTPNPSEKMVKEGNFSLTPVVMAGPGMDSGIPTSNTTKRRGLVANVDFVPTVFSHFGYEAQGYIGEPIKVTKADEPIQFTVKNLAQFKNLKVSRYIIHGFYVAFTVLAMIGIYAPFFGRRPVISRALARVLACSVVTLPMTTFVLSPFLNYGYTYLFALPVVFTALISGYLISRWPDSPLPLLGMASLITGAVLLAGLFTGGELYLNSPLGFDDVFMGGRYYGMNNDTMGILLGASVFGLFVLLQISGLPRWAAVTAGLFYTLLPVIGLSPAYGANVGGTIAAMVVATVAVVVLAGRKPVNWSHVVLIVIAVFAVEVGIAYLDATLNKESTHAGKVLAELLAGDFRAKFLHILWSKLSLFFLMLIVPPWNLILLAEFYLVYKLFRRGHFDRLYETNQYLAKGFTVLFFGGVVAFLFNDTGVIATAMMFTYLVIPLGLQLSDIQI